MIIQEVYKLLDDVVHRWPAAQRDRFLTLALDLAREEMGADLLAEALGSGWTFEPAPGK